MFSSFFEQDHLLNLFNLAVLRKDHLNEHVFQTGLVSEKTEALYMQNLTKQRKQPPVVILQQANFYDILILCLWLRIIRISYQSV